MPPIQSGVLAYDSTDGIIMALSDPKTTAAHLATDATGVGYRHDGVAEAMMGNGLV